MRNLIQDGRTLDYTVGDDTVKSGQLVIVGDMAGVAVTDGESGETIVLFVSGVYSLPKAGVIIKQGAKVYVNAEGKITHLAENSKADPAVPNFFAGYAWDDADAGDDTVHVKINF